MAKKKTSKQAVTNIFAVSRKRLFTTSSAEETRSLGRALAGALRPGDVVLLKGELGSGKTTFVQGIAGALGVKGFVRSSSFILVNEYRAKNHTPLYHIDLYRLAGGEIDDLGLEEYVYGKGICVIEWADRLHEAAIPVSYELKFRWIDGGARAIEVQRKRRS